jgi:HSP20 family protein
MSVRDLIPWSRGGNHMPGLYRSIEQDPFTALQRDVNRLFDDVFRDFDLPASIGRPHGWAGNWPNIELSETDKEIRIEAEVPGLEKKDVEVMLQDGVLTLRGEKRSQASDKEQHMSERFYGRFERRIPVGMEIEEDKVDATFKNGVLTVTLPKTAQALANTKRIAVH